MHIVLVSPSSFVKSLPIGLAYLASNLQPEYGDTVEIVDAGALDLDIRQTCDRVLAAKTQVVGISYVTYQAEWCYKLSLLLKEADTNIIIVHGGIHASVLPLEACANGADCVVIGEGEQTFQELINRVRGGQGFEGVAGLCYRKPSSREVITNVPRSLVKNLDTLVPPQWNIFNLSLYHEDIHVVPGRALPIMASRGCAFNCSFCASLWKRKVRYRATDNVIAELANNISRHGIRKYHFYDDNLLINVKFTETLCQRMIDEHLDIEWCCEARVGQINRNPAILNLMRDAGCRGIEIGVESLDQTVLDKINKRQTIGDSLEAFQHLRRSNIKPILLLMTCNVGETIAGHYHQNRRLTQMTGRRAIYWGQYATPFPGSKFFDEARQEGVMLAEHWSDYVTQQMNFIPNSLLNNVPVRNQRRLWPWDKLLFRIELSNALSVQGMSTNTCVTASNVYELIDGERTVQGIADEFIRGHGTLPKITLQEVVKVIITLAQLGLISSAKPNGQTKAYGFIWLLDLAVKQLIHLAGRILLTFKHKARPNMKPKRTR